MENQFQETAAALREFALGLPGAYEDFPWGQSVAKVNKKVFVFFDGDQRPETGLSLGVKLPVSGEDVLNLPFAEPMGYGLGKSGWVTARFQPDDTLPLDMLRGWIEESYRAVAPRKLVAQLDGRAAPAA